MTFNIRDHIEFNQKGRAQCPCCLADGKTSLNLSVQKSGAYKCFRSCTTEDIRNALGQAKPKQVAAPPKAKTKGATQKQIEAAHEKLMHSNNCLPWLLARGIRKEAIQHYQLGAVRSGSKGKGHKPCVSIPIPLEDGRYGIKKRVAPWLSKDERGDAPPWMQTGLGATVYSTHAPESPREIWLCEGEWDAIALGWLVRHSDMKNDIHIACFTCGAGNIPPASELDRLPNVPIVTFYDLDEPGQKGAAKLQNRYKDRVLVAQTPAPEDHKPGWDVSDAINNRITLATFHKASANAKRWEKPKKENPLRNLLQSNDEMVANARDYVDWLVADILTPDELFIVGMPPRGGKSLLGLTLAKSVATGGTFLDRPVTQGSVIYINLEDSPTKIKTRQQRQGWAEGLPVYWLDKFKLSELEYLKELAGEIEDLRLVVIDTFSRARDDAQKESSAELGKILEPLQEWAKESSICILLTHHTGKANLDHPNADPFDALRGSTSIRATCRGAIVIVPGEQSYRLIAENGFSDRLDLNVHINPQTLEWRLNGQWMPRIDGDMKQQILDHLNLHGEATVAEIASVLSFNAASVSTIMSRLHRDDMVKKRGGKGRSPAVYSRSSNLLKQQNHLFEHPNQDGVRSTALLKQNNLSGDSPEKVINGPESDQSVDHFEEKAPTHIDLFEQSCKPDGARDVCSNSTSDQFEQNEATPKAGQKVRYCGENWQKQKALGRKHLVVDSTKQNAEGWWVTVSHKDVAISQTVPASDVKLIES